MQKHGRHGTRLSTGRLRGGDEAAPRGRQRALFQQLRPAGGHKLRAPRRRRHRRSQARLRHLGQHRQRGVAHGLDRRHGQDPSAVRNRQGERYMCACMFLFLFKVYM